MRTIVYVTGTRADFGLMRRTLEGLRADAELALSVAVTGTHLSPQYGETLGEIEACGLPIFTRIPVEVERTTGTAMARTVGEVTVALADAFGAHRPDLVMILGDRGEMLAAAVAALYQNVPIVHLHGGERSGTVDEPVRHAISKLAHYHFVATQGAKERLIRMGEDQHRIFVTGAPGLVGIADIPVPARGSWCSSWKFDAGKPVGLLVYHPVVQEWTAAGQQALAALRGALDAGLQLIVLLPNADAGASLIRDALQGYGEDTRLHFLKHMPRDEFLAAMSVVDIMVGNSSSGIIEAASFNLPVVNIGPRQQNRERSGNVIDVPADRDAVRGAIEDALAAPRGPWMNVYGDDRADKRIRRLLIDLPLDTQLLSKNNAY